MDTIPEEIIKRIAHFFAGERSHTRRIAAFAVRSYKWQRPVEWRTFEHLRVTGHDDDLEMLEQVVLANLRRRAHLRYLQFPINLDSSTSTGGRTKNREIRADVRFTDGVAKPFRTFALADKGDDGAGAPTHTGDGQAGEIKLQIVPVLSPCVETKKKLKNNELQLPFAACSRALERMPVLENATLFFELMHDMDKAQPGAGVEALARYDERLCPLPGRGHSCWRSACWATLRPWMLDEGLLAEFSSVRLPPHDLVCRQDGTGSFGPWSPLAAGSVCCPSEGVMAIVVSDSHRQTHADLFVKFDLRADRPDPWDPE
ncbi:hypothetical protein MAPG_03178 [Magnaporthiopsis poae ATCC 64411]|uniref:Uncharacterized protein n=1 Tax=Magnaporthiopsis poae (strain ATCC 64411 / 73-15) TaxID=644358 RepID=A0A0C4DTB6_MAGP6|nr:hypothetical protein MAPG_03178 [Magnaporthiopsis poae ATCC 64411]